MQEDPQRDALTSAVVNLLKKHMLEGTFSTYSISPTHFTCDPDTWSQGVSDWSNVGTEDFKASSPLLGGSKKIKKQNIENSKQQANTKKGLWSPEEDSQLIDLVAKYGSRWAKIADEMPGKERRQIRNRYLNALQPGINFEEWTEEEERRLDLLQKEFKNKWCEIAKRMPGRTENQVKNKYYWGRRHSRAKNLTSAKTTKKKESITDLTVNINLPLQSEKFKATRKNSESKNSSANTEDKTPSEKCILQFQGVNSGVDSYFSF